MPRDRLDYLFIAFVFFGLALVFGACAAWGEIAYGDWRCGVTHQCRKWIP